MVTRFHTLKRIASLGSATIAITLLSSCSGAGLGPSSRGPTPDLVVAPPSVSDAGPVAGTQFTLWATVRNVGDGASEATRLRYYQSTDATITTADTEVSADTMTGLAASKKNRESVDLTAPAAAGTYYYGACVDAVTGESDTTNNCSASVEVTVQEPELGEPDLVVAPPTVSDSALAAGATFTLAAAVRNDGEGAAGATTLRYYRSTDATITTSDTEVGSAAVAGLAASASSTESVDIAAPAAAGPYYYGACVDAVTGESDTTNNCSASVEVMVQDPELGEPDLVVATPTVSDSALAAGATFTLAAAVRNDGEGAAGATTLRYYGSTDATITTSDTEVGSAAVAGLAASASSTESVDIAAPAAAGPYYYGACVDAVTGESDTTNNCSASVEVTIKDSVVATPTVSDSAPAAGATFTLAVKASAGDEAAATMTLNIYRSTDATVTTSDTLVGKVVAELVTSETSSQSRLAAATTPGAHYSGEVELTAPDKPGTYYYGACVDAVDTTDNCSPAAQVAVREARSSNPDLVVATPTVSDDSPAPRVVFSLSVTVRNDGDGSSAATTLRYYRSTDATISTSDTEVWSAAVAGLAASASSTESANIAAPAAAGPYYYGACVDSVTGESDATNNCSSAVAVTVEGPAPELVVLGPSVSDSNPETGGKFRLLVTVHNQGDTRSAATTVRYYRSIDATITTSDTEVDTDSVNPLVPSGGAAKTVSLTAPSSTGTYYYGACVDAVTDESDTTNNCSVSVQVDVSEPPPKGDGPDLVVEVSGDPLVRPPGGTVTVSAEVRNDGNEASAATTLSYYRSTNMVITTFDTLVGTDSVTALSAGATSNESIDVTLPSAEWTYYYGACVDSVTDESDTTNNCSSGVAVTVSDPQTSPDLSVGAPSVNDNSPEPGEVFTLMATVSNDGDDSSAATTLRYYRSTDATITTSDTEVGTDSVAGLAAAGTSDQSVDLTAPSSPGTHYYGACVDAVADESDTSNNCSTSVPVNVLVSEPQMQAQPDLEVGTPTVDDASPEAGATITLSATVSNTGGGASAATTLRFYRSR